MAVNSIKLSKSN